MFFVPPSLISSRDRGNEAPRAVATDRVPEEVRGTKRQGAGGGKRREDRISGGINVKGTERSVQHQEEEVRAGGGEAKRTERPRCCRHGRGKDADYGVSNNHADCIFCADSFCLPPRLLV